MEQKDFKVIKGGEESEQVKKVKEQIKEMQEPKIIKKLELGSGEIYLGDLKNADKFQVLIRHIQVIEQYLSNLFTMVNTSTICLMEIAKKQDIKIDRILNFGNEENKK